MSQPRFANARSIRNAIDRLRLRQARRLVTGRRADRARDDLMEISAEDVRASRVFREPAARSRPLAPWDKLTGPAGDGSAAPSAGPWLPAPARQVSSSFPPSSSARSRMAARPKPVGWLASAAPAAAAAPPSAPPMAAGSNPVPSSATSSTILSR